MRKFEAALGFVALILGFTQLIRDVYVRSIEPHGSVLERFKTDTEQDILAAKSLGDLVALYEPAWKKSVAEKQKNPSMKESEISDTEKEPYKSERVLRQAIETWEDHARQIVEVHYFWWIGFGCCLLGAVCYRWIQRWFGLSIMVVGFIEMFWATCPSFRVFGNMVEFDKLLTWKLVYSAATILLLLGIWVFVRFARPQVERLVPEPADGREDETRGA